MNHSMCGFKDNCKAMAATLCSSYRINTSFVSRTLADQFDGDQIRNFLSDQLNHAILDFVDAFLFAAFTQDLKLPI